MRFSKEILCSKEYLAEVEKELEKLKDKPALIVWSEADGAFRKPDRLTINEVLSQSQTLFASKS